MGKTDVIVVGAGVVGCSTAYRLAQSGRNVLVIDQRGIASGASGRNGGMTGAGSTMHAGAGEAVYAITTANLELIRQLPEELECDFELRLPGNLNVATNEAQWKHLEESVAIQKRSGLNVELLDRDEARRLMPALSESILGAEYSPDPGHLWPFRLVHGFANKARAHGARFRLGERVDELVRTADRVIGVRIGTETILADEVVLCTNAYTPQILPDLPAGAIVPARGQILVTQAVPDLLPHPFGTNFDKEYGRQTPDGKILCGGFRRLDDNEGLGHYEERVTPAVLNGIASCLTTLFPRLANVRVVRCWAGIMGFTADGLPVIGKAEFAPGLTIAAGFNGGGFSWAAITGKIVTRLLNGEEPGFDMTHFSPHRFHDRGTSWSNPFTAGEESNASHTALVV
jgi:sarcosine oxidase subunit beta